MRWEFHNDSPIYAQIMDRIERMIVSGTLEPGAKLPAVRSLAMEAGVNPTTMQNALTELERGGLIFSQRTNGHFVTEDAETISKARAALAAKQTAAYLRRMTELGYTPEQAAKLLQEQLH
jgi:DNA-binding transcriptional regulator YhcF (GntR family)